MRSQPLLSEFVTGNYFPILGVGAAMGRMFGLEAENVGDPQAVAVMNYGTWQTRSALLRTSLAGNSGSTTWS